jgi:hypothetical protein
MFSSYSTRDDEKRTEILQPVCHKFKFDSAAGLPQSNAVDCEIPLADLRTTSPKIGQ